jgi:hypothetical protein
LGTSGGLVAGQQHSEAQCYINALEIENQNTDVSNRNTIHPCLADAWVNLGTCGGGVVGGRQYSLSQCYMGAQLGVSEAMAATKQHELEDVISAI